MPTLSFPLTIRVSIDVPEFLAPQAAAPADVGAWQFKADYVDGPGPVESTEEIIAEIHRRIGLTEPQVVTESEYTPAPKVPGKRTEVGRERAEVGEQRSEVKGQGSADSNQYSPERDAFGSEAQARRERLVQWIEATQGSMTGADVNERPEIGGQWSEAGGQKTEDGGPSSTLRDAFGSEAQARREPSGSDSNEWSQPGAFLDLKSINELPELPAGHPWRRLQLAARELQGTATQFQPAAAQHQPAASYTQPTASYEQPAKSYEQPVEESTRSAAEPNHPADPPPQEKATRPKIVGDVKLPTETTLEGEEITPAQQTAILLMLRGASIAKAAQAIGVHPNTVHRWKREDARFRAVWNAQRNDYHDAARAKMEFLGNQVAYVLSEEISKGNFRAALQVAKGLGLLTGKPPEPAEESAEQIEQVDRAQALAKEAQTEAKHWLESLPARKKKIKFWKNKEQRRALYAEKIRKRLDKLAARVKEWQEQLTEANTVVAEGSGI